MKGYFKCTITAHNLSKEGDSIKLSIPRELSRELATREADQDPVLWIKLNDPDQELRDADIVMSPEQLKKLMDAIPKGQSMQVDKKILVDSTQEFPGVDEGEALKEGYSSVVEFLRRMDEGQFDVIMDNNMFAPVILLGYLGSSRARRINQKGFVVISQNPNNHKVLHPESETRREMEEHTEVFDDSKYPGITYMHPEAENYDTYEGDTRVRRIIMPVDWLESYPGSDKHYGYVLGVENQFGGLNVPHKQVLRSGAGYYIGWLSKEDLPATQTEPGGTYWMPEARDSQRYWRSRRQAEEAMIKGDYEVKF